MRRHMRAVAAIVGILLFGHIVAGGEPKANEPWPQFRGPDGQGHVSSNIPTFWSDSVNKVWDVAIPGKGWSSPVVADGKVWMTTAVPAKGASVTFRAIAAAQDSGKLLHDVELFEVAKPAKLHDRNTLATPSPVVANGRLYAQFGGDGVACIDTAAAKVVWKNDTLKADYQTGPASSPVLYKELLIIACDAGDVQYAVALSIKTGDIVWKSDRPHAVNLKKNEESRRAFATPLLIKADGRDQVVMPGAFCVYSYDPATGAELWRVTYGGFSNVPRPVYAHGLVYVTTGFTPPDLIAIRPDGQGDVTKTHIAWRVKKNVPNVPSPIVVGNNLIMISDRGVATCLDAKNGGLKWSEQLNANFSASPLAKGNIVYAFADDGKTVLFEAGDTFKELGRNELSGHIQATPAAVGDHLFIRTKQELVKVGPSRAK
jgi:outer membrane protein assembly factor BamB